MEGRYVNTFVNLNNNGIALQSYPAIAVISNSNNFIAKASKKLNFYFFLLEKLEKSKLYNYDLSSSKFLPS